MFADTHTHTAEFSADAEMTFSELLQFLDKNPQSIACTTEHYDFDYPVASHQLIMDLEEYFSKRLLIKNAYESENQRPFPVLMGVEYGYMRHLGHFFDILSGLKQFDSIVCSAHYIDDCDPYFDREIYLKGKDFVYGLYLETIIHSLNNCSGFDVIGHFDYISRFAPYDNRIMTYRDFPDHFDTIFSLCINKGKALELNTKTCVNFSEKSGRTILFDVDIIKRYRQLGGELITLGSDAHKTNALAGLFNETTALLKENNYKYITYFKDRNPVFIPI